jgi:hypothetical protein
MAETGDSVVAGTQFPKGVSGNPAGRPKGSKNKHKISKRRELVEAALTKAVAGEVDNLALLVRTMIQDAQNHENEGFRMQNRKLVIDKFLPSTAQPKSDGEADDNTITIQIGTVTLGDQPVVETAIEGDFTIEDDNEQSKPEAG